MSWIQKLYETYEACAARSDLSGDRPFPLDQTTQNAQIEVAVDGEGRFLRAAVVDKQDARTPIPCTEKSASRSGVMPEPHPLCDKLQYLAADFRDFGGEVTKGFQKDRDEPHASYLVQLGAWAEACPHPKLRAILAYLRKGRLTDDLVRARILPVGADGMILKTAPAEDKKDVPIWAALAPGQAPEDAFIRWRVEIPGDPAGGTWQDDSLVRAWSDYVLQQAENRGPCMVTGEADVAVARLHPAKLRHPSDKAKLISANDGSGFTFRGRFTDTSGLQACSVGAAVTQKAHNALRWLIARQGYRRGGQAYVCWAVSGAPLPQPLASTQEILDAWDAPLLPESASAAASAGIGGESGRGPSALDHSRDAGQSFARKLKNAMQGYSAKLHPTEDIMLMGLDAATPGRMSLIFYRELKGSEFLERLENWHLSLAWPQRVSLKDETGRKAIGVEWRAFAPSPERIAETAYGRRLDDKLRNATVERLLACIIDGRDLPRDLVESCVRRATHRAGLENWEWEQHLGVACAVYKGYYKRRGYTMALDETRASRDYLYGRLLAVADHLEGAALALAGERRETTAARLMQRFADRPCATWRDIELKLGPYKSRLRAHPRKQYLLVKLEKIAGAVYDLFDPGDYASDQRLGGEFLLGYHCQIQDLWRNPPAGDELSSESTETDKEKNQ